MGGIVDLILENGIDALRDILTNLFQIVSDFFK